MSKIKPVMCSVMYSGHVLIQTKNHGKVKRCGTDGKNSEASF